MENRFDPEQAFPGSGHDHEICIGGALDRAAAVCSGKGARLTELRRRVLELIWSGHRPLGAYDILSTLRRERRSAEATTVYRTLDFLLEQGLIHRIESLNAFFGCRLPETPHDSQFLICRSCGSTAEVIDSRIDDAIRDSALQAGFQAGHRTIEVEGLCPQCQNLIGDDAIG